MGQNPSVSTKPLSTQGLTGKLYRPKACMDQNLSSKRQDIQRPKRAINNTIPITQCVAKQKHK